MSGDVQPRKRKDKKRKKDDLGVEEPRGTAAALGEGDVFMHSHHEHGTGGHWCAKIIFFSLLAVLITLVGLIILENRGLSELEANAVESRYSGVLEGWLEDAPDDDHHDEHTLELTHHDHDENTHHLEDEDDEIEHNDDDNEEQPDDEDDHEEYDEEENDHEENDLSNEDDGEQSDDDELAAEDDDNDELAAEDDELADEDNDNEDEDNENSQEQDNQNDEDEEETEEYNYRRQQDNSEEVQEIDDNDYNSNEDDNEIENNEDDDDDDENNDIKHESDEENEYKEENEDDDEHDDEDDGDDDVELERLEKETEELLNEEPISTELPALPENDEDTNENDNNEDVSAQAEQDDEDDGEEEEYLELDDNEESIVEHITAPPGKPLMEVEDDADTEQPPNTLDEEEEYEKRQAELRREEEQSSHMWLKLTVGGALLVATHAVMRRATRDSQDEEDEIKREQTPLTDRRMTLIADEPSAPVPVERAAEEILQPKIEKKLESIFPAFRPTIIKKQESEEEDELQSEDEDVKESSPMENKEYYNDEEEELIESSKLLPNVTTPVEETKPAQESEPEDEDPDDVEIINDEQLEEEFEEEDEEEISDVDDAELLTRLEAKYGKLPEPERPGQKHKDGGNNIDEDWPGEPRDAFWRRQLDSAERELRQGEWNAAIAHAGADALRDSARARWIVARALDQLAEVQRDNRLLSRAITSYLNLLKMNERLSDKKLLQVTERTLDRIQFRGTYLNAEPVYKLLIRRFPNDPVYRNNLTISFLMANRPDLAEDTLKETLKLWPNDRVALAHYGFVLKTSHNRYEDAIKAFEKALEGDTGPATEARFYYHYGDALLLLGRPDDAHEVHKRGAALGHFLSPEQRSLYNVPRLKSRPWWKIEDTPYTRLARALERSWKEILKEGEAAKALFEKEKEGLKERGEWSQMDLFVRGQEIPGRCKKAPVTCSVVKSEPAAVGCRRGQIKFSLMAPGTHVRPHVGPTNCRLRMHLGLSNTKDTYIRVDKEIRQWQTGKTFVFDDSFEHEVWHNGTGTRLVLIVDVWHPQLTATERRQLPAI